ncbi:MAG: hypothetical protein KDA21_03855 [Phycisphaerales bacterium]|nr:hypothetical protein [Phycisphaerales bacterium]
MSIFPLPQFEEDVEAYRKDREAYEKLSVPKSMVVRFGVMKLIGEYPYNGDAKPGCGSKVVVRSHRGTELAEMLTSTCPNAGCSKSVTRQEMLDYIENSGGKDYPFYNRGKVLRVATIDDINEHARLDATRLKLRATAQQHADQLNLDMKVVEAEPILGGERLTFYFMSEDRIDFRELVQLLASEFSSRIEMRQVGARDEARLTADYERCGQHCCCKQFLKVLKPVSMRSAKQQKATLDPLKISGRCGRLMCCLRYEDQTYNELSKRLPRMRKRVGTPHGIGVVVDRQILTQLVLVQLEDENLRVAVTVEDIVPPDQVETVLGKYADPLRGMSEADAAARTSDRRSGRSRHEQQDGYREQSQAEGDEETEDGGPKKKRRRRRKRGSGGAREQAGAAEASENPSEPAGESGGGDSPTKKRRRRRRRRSGSGGSEPGAEGSSQRPEGDGGGQGGEGSGGDGTPRKRRRRRRRRSGGGEGGDGSGAGSGGGGGGDGGE